MNSKIADSAYIYRTTNADTPLYIAVRKGHADIAALLVEHGADIYAVDNDEHTTFKLAVYGGHAQVVKMLLERGYQASGADDPDEPTHMDSAAMLFYQDVLEVLLEHGADRERNTR